MIKDRPRSYLSQSSSYTNILSSFNQESPPQQRPPSPVKPNHHRSINSLSHMNLRGLPSSSSSSPVVNEYNMMSPSIGSPLFDRDSHGSAATTGGSIRAPMNEAVAVDHAKMQNKVFCNWVNSRLEPHGFLPVTNLNHDFHDGTRLIQLVEALTEQSLGRYNQLPTHRVQKFENAKMGLDRIKEMGVHLTNIGPEDIVDGNLKLILGMIWSLVLRFSIADISEEGSHAKEGLLLWCQRKTQGYEGVDVQNFTRSFQDGLAFCALIHRHRPDLLDWESLPKDPRHSGDNLRRAFRIAEEKLGIKQWLDVEDVCSKRPDDKSIMTYVAQFFHAFSTTAQTETEARVIGNFIENMSTLMSAVHDYEQRVTELLNSFHTTCQHFSSPFSANMSFSELISERSSIDKFRKEELRSWIQERLNLINLLINIQTKLKTYGLRVYTPAEEFSSEFIEKEMMDTRRVEMEREREINSRIRTIQEQAQQRVITLSSRLYQRLSNLTTNLASLTGPLDSQLEMTRTILNSLPSLSPNFDELSRAEIALLECEAPISDGSGHSHESLLFEYDTINSIANARKSFNENQMIARKTTSIRPEELEEFESVFRAFDKDQDNHLSLDELEGAIGALGIGAINLAEMHDTNQSDLVSFNEFMAYLVQRGEDRLTSEKVKSCFRSAAVEKGYVTELDLSRLELPRSTLEFLQEWMPSVEVEGHDQSNEGACFDFERFLETFVEEG